MDAGSSFIQVDVAPQLETLAVRELPDPDPEHPDAWRPIVSESNRAPWVAGPPLGVRPEPFNPERLPFVSQQHQEAMSALAAFQASYKSDARLNGETGLPVFLYGDLLPDHDGSDHLKAAATFLTQNQLIVAGRNRFVGGEAAEVAAVGVQLGVVQRLSWPDRTDQVRFQQYSPKGGAIYGAQVVATFDATDRLVLISSSLYPAVEELPAWPADLPPPGHPLYAEQSYWTVRLFDLVPAELGFKRLMRGSVTPWVYPQRRFADLPDDAAYLQHIVRSWRYDYENRHWRFDADYWEKATTTPIAGRYVLVVEAAFEDAHGSFWRAILDVSRFQEPRLIELIPDEHEAPPDFYLFPTPQLASNYFGQLGGPNPPDPQVLADQLGLKRTLDFGAGSSFNDADGVSAPGYQYPGSLPLPNVDRFRAPTVYYHLRQAQYNFGDFFNSASIAAIAPPAALTNPLNSITVLFEDSQASCKYTNGVIYVRRATATPPPIREPGCDAEVVVHEYTHALVDFYFNNLFSRSLGVNWIVDGAVNGLNEAQAFYLATSVFAGSQWSEYAYGRWGTARDLSQPSGSFDYNVSASDAAGAEHGLGVWLARLFWRIATTTQGRSTDFLLYKAFGALAGAVLGNVATGTGRNARFRAVLSLFATMIWMQCDAPGANDPAPQRNGVQQVFTNVGLTVP